MLMLFVCGHGSWWWCYCDPFVNGGVGDGAVYRVAVDCCVAVVGSATDCIAAIYGCKWCFFFLFWVVMLLLVSISVGHNYRLCCGCWWCCRRWRC